MTNKFISLALSLALVIALLPMMSLSVSATGGTAITTDDFESYNVGVVTDGTGTAVKLTVDDTAKWNMMGSTITEIVEMPGFDTKPTKALKIKSAASSKDAGRHKLLPAAEYNSLAGKVYVQEYKIYLPAHKTVSSGAELIVSDYKHPQKINLGYTTQITDDYLWVYAMNTGYKLPEDQWVKITAVVDFTNYAANGDPVSYAVYVNDENVFYKSGSTESIGANRLTKYNASYWFVSTNNIEDDITDQHFLIDDVNIYHTPDSTVASSNLDNATKVSRFVNPTVTFSNTILDAGTDADKTLSLSNVVVTKVADSSTVEVSNLSLSNGGKTLTVDIKDALDYSNTYNVKLTGLKDFYGATIPDYQFSFKVMDEPPFASLEPTFTKIADLEAPSSSEETITSLENGYVNANYTVVNNSNSGSKDVFMFAVLRENGALKLVDFKQGTIQARESLTINAGFNIDDCENQSIEIYVWDDLVNRNALVSSYVISADGITSTAD